MRNDAGDAMFGGGVAYGTWFRDACSSIPAGGFPAVVVLSWDGGTNGQQHSNSSSTPLLLIVGNNKTSSSTNTIVLMYMPKAVKPESGCSQPRWRKVQLDVKQQVVTHILRAMAKAALDGFMADIHGQARLLYPRLATVILDHPEMQDFFQASNQRFSTRARIRKGG